MVMVVMGGDGGGQVGDFSAAILSDFFKRPAFRAIIYYRAAMTKCNMSSLEPEPQELC